MPVKLVDTAGIEPASLLCQRSILPLNYRPMVGEDGIEPSPSDFQSVVHTEYTILPLKLVAVLWASTPLSPQRTASKSIMSGNPFHHGAEPVICVSSHLDKKQRELVEWQFSQWQDLFNPGIMPCTANTLRCLVRDMRHQRGLPAN